MMGDGIKHTVQLESVVECASSDISCIMIIRGACKTVENDLDVNEDEGRNLISLTYNCVLMQAI